MKLKRSMGLWMATALVVGNMIGSGIFLLPATLADAAGPVSLIGWAFTGAGAGEDIVTKGFVLLLCGIPVYVGMRWWEHRKAEHVLVPEVRELVDAS